MSERPYKVEQWSRDFDGVTKVILEASDPKEAHAEFDRVVKRRPRGWYTVPWGTQVMHEHPRAKPYKPAGVPRTSLPGRAPLDDEH
jgi:hypothetical protein